LAKPSVDEYSHIGDTTILLRSVTSRRRKVEKSSDIVACNAVAAPAVSPHRAAASLTTFTLVNER
jgi:hypothetical protein